MNKAELIQLLEFEISTRRAAESQPGWSTWAILGAIATLLWLMLSEIETAVNLTYSNIIYLFIVLSLSIDLILIAYLAIRSLEKNDAQDSNRFIKLNATATSFVVLLVSRSILIFYLFDKISSTFEGWIYIATYLYLILSLFTASVMIVAFVLKLPIPKNPNPKKAYKIFGYLKEIVWGISCTISVIGLLSYLYKGQIAPSVSDWKVGLICIALSALIISLFKKAPKTSYLPVFESLYRRTTLENLDIEEAKKQIDLVLFGMTLPDILQSHISSILKVYDDLQKLYSEYCSEIAVIEKYVETPANELNDEAGTTLHAIVKSMVEKPQDIEKLRSKLTKLTKKLSYRTSFLIGTDKTILHRIETYISIIDKAKENLNEMTCASCRKLESLKQKLERKMSSPQQIASGDAHSSRA